MSAVAAFVALQNAAAPTQEETAPNSILTFTTETLPAVSEPSTPTYEGCIFSWAYYDAPELTEKVDAAIRIINEQASARASLFGEDCIYADGQSTFGVMETDFYIRLPADDLTTEAAFGDWMAQILAIITKIPRDEIQGNYGFVEFWFEKTSTEKLIVRVPIQQYIDEAQKKTGAELFRMFYNPP